MSDIDITWTYTDGADAEREAIAAYLESKLIAGLDRLDVANPGQGYDREAFRVKIHVERIRSGDHHKGSCKRPVVIVEPIEVERERIAKYLTPTPCPRCLHDAHEPGACKTPSAYGCRECGPQRWPDEDED